MGSQLGRYINKFFNLFRASLRFIVAEDQGNNPKMLYGIWVNVYLVIDLLVSPVPEAVGYAIKTGYWITDGVFLPGHKRVVHPIPRLRMGE